MKQALISPEEKVYSYAGDLLGDRVAEVTTQPFEVASPLVWVSCSDDCVADQWYYNGSSFKQIPLAPAPVEPVTPVEVPST
jgi:hypothetical protein